METKMEQMGRVLPAQLETKYRDIADGNGLEKRT